MTVQLKVKWYINGNQWWIWEPSLLTYEEIAQYTDIDALLVELNKYPEEYYNELLSTYHVYSCASNPYYLTNEWNWKKIWWYLPAYDIYDKLWYKWPSSAPCPS